MCLECAAPLHRQRYRLKTDLDRSSLRVCPEWFEDGGVYEGDIHGSNHDVDGGHVIRLLNPSDHDVTFVVDEDVLEEVD